VGKDSIITLADGNSKDLLTVNLTTKGDVCFYRIKNSCGKLKIDVDPMLMISNDMVLVEYMEFEID
jgi:hypothetical protein